MQVFARIYQHNSVKREIVSFCDNIILISSKIVQVILTCNSYNLISLEQLGSISN